jgi:hypothetical protein
MCGFCKVCVCVCVDFVKRACVCVGFISVGVLLICVLILTAFCTFFSNCDFVLFHLCVLLVLSVVVK